MSDISGQVTTIRGLVCEVALVGTRPEPKELLALRDDTGVVLEVIDYPNAYTARCINITGSAKVRRGSVVMRTNTTVTVPKGRAVLGRVLNALGQPVDGGDPIEAERQSIYERSYNDERFGSSPELLETGIKVIDFFAPFVK